MKIHLNVSGTPPEQPLLVADDATVSVGDLSVSGRCSFTVSDTINGGFTVYWNGQSARSVFPPYPRVVNYEGADLEPPLPPLTYTSAPSGLHIVGEDFYRGAVPWCWRGATDFRLAKLLMDGHNIDGLLAQRKACGANLVRVLAMKANNTGWALNPSTQPDYWGGVQRFWDRLARQGVYCEWTVFADTRTLMPEPDRQYAFWAQTCDFARTYPHVLLELVNEHGHGTQSIDPWAFGPPNDVLASHGSGLTDAAPVFPLWSYATYHARRDAPPDGRGFTNYDPYEFQASWPKPCPYICDEGIKPEQYGYNPAWAAQMGRHANIACGATFHTGQGVNSEPWTPEIERCAVAFYQELA